MEISVVVPTYNREKTVLRTLESLFAQTARSIGYEVIVVVDGATDGTAEALRRLTPDCKMRVIEQANCGPAAARNTGYRAAESDLVLFVDDDMVCDKNLIAAHIGAHGGNSRCVVFGSIFLSADSPPSLAAECFRREIGAFHLEKKRNLLRDWRITDCVFSNASVPRALLEDVGGFDETFRMREDLELGIRLFNIGVKPVYVDAAITHQYFDKSASDLIRDAEAFAAGDVRLARKHPGVVIEGQLEWLARMPWMKLHALRLAAAFPAMVDFLLKPVCAIGKTLFGFPTLRNWGVRALQVRRRIHWLNKVQELGWRLDGAGSKRDG